MKQWRVTSDEKTKSGGERERRGGPFEAPLEARGKQGKLKTGHYNWGQTHESVDNTKAKRKASVRPLSLGRAPGIDDSNAAIGKVGAIPCGKLSPMRPRNGRDLGIRVADRSSKRPTVRCNAGKMARSVTLECEYASREVFRKHPFRCSQQGVAPLTFGEQFNSVKDFRLRDRGRKEVCRLLLGDPGHDLGGRLGPHELRQHIRIEDDHASNPGAWRTASRCGKESSIPPSEANLRRIDSAKFPLVREELVKAERKISRASSSIERPWWAARTLKRVLVFWSSCRIVSVAMPAMIALLASDAKRRWPNSTHASAPLLRSGFCFMTNVDTMFLQGGGDRL